MILLLSNNLSLVYTIYSLVNNMTVKIKYCTNPGKCHFFVYKSHKNEQNKLKNWQELDQGFLQLRTNSPNKLYLIPQHVRQTKTVDETWCLILDLVIASCKIIKIFHVVSLWLQNMNKWELTKVTNNKQRSCLSMKRREWSKIMEEN